MLHRSVRPVSCFWIDRWCHHLGTWQHNIGVVQWIHSCFLWMPLVGIQFFWGWRGVCYLRLCHSTIGHPLCSEITLFLCHQFWCYHWSWSCIGSWCHSQFCGFCAVRYGILWGQDGRMLYKVLWCNCPLWGSTCDCRNPIQDQFQKTCSLPNTPWSRGISGGQRLGDWHVLCRSIIFQNHLRLVRTLWVSTCGARDRGLWSSHSSLIFKTDSELVVGKPALLG